MTRLVGLVLRVLLVAIDRPQGTGMLRSIARGGAFTPSNSIPDSDRPSGSGIVGLPLVGGGCCDEFTRGGGST